MPIPAAFDLSGRVAVVTGAGAPDGIGFATARLLAELGAAVMISATTARIHPLDMAESGGLHGQDGLVIRRIRDLEQEALPGGRVHPEVLVPFAREGLERRRLNAEAFPQDLPGCLLAEGRRRALQGVRALHHRPEGYLAAHGGSPPGRRPAGRGPGIQPH